MNLTRFDETGSTDPSLDPALLNYEARMKESFARGINKLEETKTTEDESPVFDRMPTATDLAKSAYNAPLDMMISEYKRMKEMPIDDMIIENALNMIPFGATIKKTPTGNFLKLVDESFKPEEQKLINKVQSPFEKVIARYSDSLKKKDLKKIDELLSKAHPGDTYIASEKVHLIPTKENKLTGIIGNKDTVQDVTFIDPFMWADSQLENTKQLLNKYKEQGVDLNEINTGSDLIARDDYLNLIPRDAKINIYLSPGIELAPGRPSNRRLYTAYEKLKENGFDVELHNPDRILVEQLPKTHLYKNATQQDLDDLINKELNEIEKIKKVIPIKK